MKTGKQKTHQIRGLKQETWNSACRLIPNFTSQLVEVPPDPPWALHLCKFHFSTRVSRQNEYKQSKIGSTKLKGGDDAGRR